MGFGQVSKVRMVRIYHVVAMYGDYYGECDACHRVFKGNSLWWTRLRAILHSCHPPKNGNVARYNIPANS